MVHCSYNVKYIRDCGWVGRSVWNEKAEMGLGSKIRTRCVPIFISLLGHVETAVHQINVAEHSSHRLNWNQCDVSNPSPVWWQELLLTVCKPMTFTCTTQESPPRKPFLIGMQRHNMEFFRDNFESSHSRFKMKSFTNWVL